MKQRNYGYLYEVGDIISNVRSGNLKLLDKIRIKRKTGSLKAYLYECLICGHVDKKAESDLKVGSGCCVCSGQKVKIGFNDMWTTNPHLASLLFDKGNGYKYLQYSTKKLDWKCPLCKRLIKNKAISHVNSQGLSCSHCSDGISYPEKLMINILDKFNIEFIFQNKFDWAKDKKYDFYIPSCDLIIETHGIQHYKEKKTSLGRTLSEEQHNDQLKKELALSNRIENYVIINCSESNLDFIKNNIVKSELNTIFDLSAIDWIECDLNSQKSLVIESCNLFNERLTPFEISQRLHIHHSTVCRYLNKGNKLGACNYSGEEGSRYNGRKSAYKRSKPIICLNTGEMFESVSEAGRKYNFKNCGSISSNCQGKRKFAGKDKNGNILKWMYKEDYDKLIIN